jgi:hypothetical protein
MTKLDGPAQALADEIVRRLECSELPAKVGEWIRKEYPQGYSGRQSLGYGRFPALLEYRFSPDGSIWLQLGNMNGQGFWQTTLRVAAA